MTTCYAIQVPTYTELEYQHHLATPGWTRQETDHLMDLAQRFDTRFVVMHDRYRITDVIVIRLSTTIVCF